MKCQEQQQGLRHWIVIHPKSQLMTKLLSGLLLIGLGLTLGITISTSYLNTIIPSLHHQFFALISPSPPPPSTPNREGLRAHLKPSELMHDMMDDELLQRTSAVPRTMADEPSSHRVPKVAFMFLTRGPLPFAALWEELFKGQDPNLYSIYVHADPCYNGTAPPPASVFHGRRIPSKAVGWGELNMMEAERRLLASALLDLSNQRFVLLSESCIPLFDFPTIYSYLINSTTSYVESYDDPGRNGRGRYSKLMAPWVRPEQWRKGSQWFEMDRVLAVEVVSDQSYFPVFERYCSRPC